MKAFGFLCGLVILSVFSSAYASTSVKCESSSNDLTTQLTFAFQPISLIVSGSFSGRALKPYVFLNSEAACGSPISTGVSCESKEFFGALGSGSYDFQFSCSDGRRGELHFEDNSVMAYCYLAGGEPANVQGASNCVIAH
jgi:hypothetical protein